MFCSIIRLEGVGKRFGDTVAVEDAHLTVERGDFVALLGPSGCGKTTLLRLIAGFEAPDTGTVFVRGRRVAGAGTWVEPERRHVGMVFQDYALFPHLTVAENVGFGLPRLGARAASGVLALVGLDGCDARYHTSSRAASSSGLPWRALSPPLRRSSSSTSRGRMSTRSCARHFAPK